MSPTKNSKVRGVRVLDKVYEQVMAKAKGKTFNWMVNDALGLRLRSHKKKEAQDD